MTLKEKLTFNCRECDFEQNANQCEKIADDYAIEFAEWLNTLEAKYLIEDLKIIGELNKNPKTSELLVIFKKEKGL